MQKSALGQGQILDIENQQKSETFCGEKSFAARCFNG